MKRTIVIILAGMLLLTACGSSTTDVTETTTVEETTTEAKTVTEEETTTEAETEAETEEDSSILLIEEYLCDDVGSLTMTLNDTEQISLLVTVDDETLATIAFTFLFENLTEEGLAYNPIYCVTCDSGLVMYDDGIFTSMNFNDVGVISHFSNGLNMTLT